MISLEKISINEEEMEKYIKEKIKKEKREKEERKKIIKNGAIEDIISFLNEWTNIFLNLYLISYYIIFL